jgi:hypothetical protein
MSIVIIERPHAAVVEEYEQPELADGECLVRILRAAVGPSDIHVYRGDYARQHYPRVPGSDALGVVETCAGGFAPVRRVLIPQTIPCRYCAACRAGDEALCLSPGLLGRDRDGGMRSSMALPPGVPVAAPDDVDDDLAVCIPDTAYALSLVDSVGAALGRATRQTEDAYFVVFGAGFLGVLVCLAAAEHGFRPILVDIVQARLELARSLGVNDTCNPLRDFVGDQVHWITRRRYADAAVVVSEDPEAVLTATSVLRPGGTLLLTGYHPDSSLPVTRIIEHSLRVRGVRRSRTHYGAAAGFIRRNAAAYGSLVSLKLEPASMPGALELIAGDPKAYMKVICRFG